MKINEEMLACYVEGKVTKAERKFVRQHLTSHPEDLNHIIGLMNTEFVDSILPFDNDEDEEVDLFPDDVLFAKSTKALLDNALFSAAFVPPTTKRVERHNRNFSSEDLLTRMDAMLKEIENN